MPVCSATSSGRSRPDSDHAPSPRCRLSVDSLSCSSAMSPTISSTRSSSVTTPSVPPYSSTTTAICMPWSRNSVRRGSSSMLSGTVVAGSVISVSRTERRRSGSTPTACLTCTMPSTSSGVRPMTGNREWPVSRAASMTSCAVSRPSRNRTCTRGVRTSAAVRSPKAMLRATSSAVSSSMAPFWADRSTSDRSSIGERAERSSSCGSTPTQRRMALAVPLSARMGHAIARVNHRWGS